MNRFRCLLLATVVLGCILAASAQNDDSPRLTFINQSGENCLVKVIGTTTAFVPVPDGTQRSVAVRGGRYYIITRYGDAGRYRYSRGEPFNVVESEYSVSDISITLHKVIGGNYVTHPDSGRDF